jgi:hypothetical protein
MPEIRHCRHCLLGGCRGECVHGQGEGRCIHGWNGKHAREFRWRYLRSRRWWHHVFWGSY